MKSFLINNSPYLLDRDLALLLNTTTKRVNQIRKRNLKLFSKVDSFILSDELFQMAIQNKLFKAKPMTRTNSTVYSKQACLMFLQLIQEESITEFKEASFESDVIKELELETWQLVENKFNLMGLIPDLLFKKENEFLIVEVQVGALDRYHLYKSLEYRDLFYIEYKVKPKLIVFCESIPKHYEAIIQIHNLDVKIKSFTSKASCIVKRHDLTNIKNEINKAFT